MGSESFLSPPNRGTIILYWENNFTALLVVGLFFILLSGLGALNFSKGIRFGLPVRKGQASSHLYKHGDKALAEGFKAQFPPSRRQAIFSTEAEHTRQVRSLLKGPSPSPTQLQSQQLPSTKSPEIDETVLYTPTGFSSEDLKALGTFPDYSALSGVPHPKPCPSFDINTATFRPFRPFRFAYHQTMCRLDPALKG